MTTAPKLIREQLLALAIVYDKRATYVGDPWHEAADVLRSLAAEPAAPRWGNVPELEDEPDSAESDEMTPAELAKRIAKGEKWELQRDTDDGKGDPVQDAVANAEAEGRDPYLAGISARTESEQPRAEGGDITETLGYLEGEDGSAYAAMHYKWIAKVIRRLSAAPQPEQPARDGVEELAKRIPRLRLRRVQDGKYLGFELIDDPEGPLCRFHDVRTSGFYADLIRAQPPQQADGGAVAFVKNGHLVWNRSYLANSDSPLPDGTKLYAGPPKSPGVGDEPLYTADEVEQAMEVLRGRDGSTALCDAVLDEMERTLLAALGGEK